MKTLNAYLNESLLDGEDALGTKMDMRAVESWIKENFKIKGTLKINKDFTVDCTGDVAVKNNNITSLTNGMFSWGEIGGEFSCSFCKNLKSLKGAPEEVGERFNCSFCDELKNLEGSPKYVKGPEFDCTYCQNLTSLEGAPEVVDGIFNCEGCVKLTSLKGAPKKVKGYINCTGCMKLNITQADENKYRFY